MQKVRVEELVELRRIEGDNSSEDELYEKDNFLPAQPGGDDHGGQRAGAVALKKELTLVSGVAVITGQIIGSGIYVAPKTVLRYGGSFGVCFALWLFGAVVAVCGGLCYIEMGLLAKRSGGEFVYITKAYSFKQRNRVVKVLGSCLGFLSLWTDSFVVRPAGLAIAALLCANYLIQPFFIGCCVLELAVKCLATALLSKCGVSWAHLLMLMLFQ